MKLRRVCDCDCEESAFACVLLGATAECITSEDFVTKL
jgi:hypothetical protein